MKSSYRIALSFAMEDQETVEKVYHYLKAQGISVFYAPAAECQIQLSGRNQREAFYEIFGMNAEYVALFVSENYISKKVPMEEAEIALASHGENGTVIPIYLDGTSLPEDLFDPRNTNYFRSHNAAKIADHLATKLKDEKDQHPQNVTASCLGKTMNINNNRADKQIFIQTLNGSIDL